MITAKEFAMEGAKFALISSSRFEETYRRCQADALRHAAELVSARRGTAETDLRSIASEIRDEADKLTKP